MLQGLPVASCDGARRCRTKERGGGTGLGGRALRCCGAWGNWMELGVPGVFGGIGLWIFRSLSGDVVDQTHHHGSLGLPGGVPCHPLRLFREMVFQQRWVRTRTSYAIIGTPGFPGPSSGHCPPPLLVGVLQLSFTRCALLAAADPWPAIKPPVTVRVDGSESCFIPARDPSTFSEDDWRHCYVGLEGPSTF